MDALVDLVVQVKRLEERTKQLEALVKQHETKWKRLEGREVVVNAAKKPAP